MLNFQQYIQETLQIDLDLILEKNKKIWPVRDENGHWKYSAISIMTGDHVEDRKSERHVDDQEIIDAVMACKKKIPQMLRDGELQVSKWKDEKKHTFVIMDARKNRNMPLTVVGFVTWVDRRFKQCNVIIKTVGKYSNFSSIMRKDTEYEKHINLY